VGWIVSTQSAGKWSDADMRPQQPDTTEVLIDINEAARRLAICARSVERLVCSGELPRVRVTRRAVRFRVADIESYILERMGTTVTA